MATIDFESLRVLVVDDDVFSQQLVTRVLETLGVVRVEVAGNGKQALERLKSAEEPFDLVISDIEMPAMGGFELARRIRYGFVPRYKDVPILMLTGHGTEENVMKGRLHRIQGFVVKPPEAEVLKRHLRRALEAR
jgi:two-component system chemotaxis response regulator CheY